MNVSFFSCFSFPLLYLSCYFFSSISAIPSFFTHECCNQSPSFGRLQQERWAAAGFPWNGSDAVPIILMEAYIVVSARMQGAAGLCSVLHGKVLQSNFALNLVLVQIRNLKDGSREGFTSTKRWYTALSMLDLRLEQWAQAISALGTAVWWQIRPLQGFPAHFWGPSFPCNSAFCVSQTGESCPEPARPQTSDDVSPAENVNTVVAPSDLKLVKTEGQAVPIKPFNCSIYTFLEVLVKIMQVTEGPHLFPSVSQGYKVKVKDSIALHGCKQARAFLAVTRCAESCHPGLQVNNI